MRRFTIDASYLGTPKHIVGDAEGYAWSESVPRDSWHLTGHIKPSPASRCLDTLLRLSRIELARPPVAHVRAFESLTTGSIAPPWRYALPRETFRVFFENVLGDTMSHFPTLPFAYYEVAWAAGSRVLAALRPACVSESELDARIDAGGVSGSLLEGFRPNRSGYARPVTYDRFSTRTGRLTVASGPNILTLKKEARAALRSSFPDGAVCSLDFRALEARIVLGETGKAAPPGDMYADVAAGLFAGRVARDVAKVAVLSELYGASKGSLRDRLGVPMAVVDSFVGAIKSHFGTDALRSRLKEELTRTGRIRNRHGRPLEVPPGQDNLLVNTYAQSTGVDVALLGFDAVLQRLGTDGIRPLFVLHDALILDVRGDRLPDVAAVDSVTVPTYDVPFPLQFEKM